MAVLIISNRKSDLSDLLMRSARCAFMSEKEAEAADLSLYSSIALLCGVNEGRAHVISAALRIKMEAFAESGRPIFYEWCASFGYTLTEGDEYNDGRDTSGDAMNRYVYIGEDTEEVSYGDLLDSQANASSIYRFIPEGAYPILYNGGHVVKHDHLATTEIKKGEIESKAWRLWYYDKTRLICSFRISEFVKARFAPFRSWCGIIRIIFEHLGVKKFEAPPPHYVLGSSGDVMNTFKKGMAWFDGCEILINNGRDGAIEGMAHTIFPNGKQEKRHNIRVDCVGEIAGAYFFDYLLNGNEDSLTVYQNLSDFVFDKMQVRSGRFRGMLRWTEAAWETLYGDDTARAMLATLFYMLYTGDHARLGEVEQALDLLVSLTGTDGLMQHGLYCLRLTDEAMAELRSTPSKQVCAHRNAYYGAALLLAYRLNHKEIYLNTAVRGLSAIMEAYPNTMRAISETEELCRLVFPLACLYEATGREEHKGWLYDVCERLELYRYKDGGYVEMDPGYTAYRSRTAGTESSMLADNGNEIAELLYSLNWLPLGFSYAYHVTGDPLFLKKWEDIGCFFTRAQIVSEDKTIDGAWARCLDLKRMEIYGMPHDVGWGPCCIESGWTVAEILMGLGLGMALKKGLVPKTQKGEKK